MAPEYPQRVLVGNFIWNTQIIPVVGECDIETKPSKLSPIILFWTARSTECILANFYLQYLSNIRPHPAQLIQYNWDRHFSLKFRSKAPGVRNVDNVIHRINCYLVDKC